MNSKNGTALLFNLIQKFQIFFIPKITDFEIPVKIMGILVYLWLQFQLSVNFQAKCRELGSGIQLKEDVDSILPRLSRGLSSQRPSDSCHHKERHTCGMNNDCSEGGT